MITSLRYAAAIVLAAIATLLCWEASVWEQRLAGADEKLVTLDATALAEYQSIERSMTVVRRFPWFSRLYVEVRERLASAAYWQSRDVAADDADPAIWFISANSAYRAGLQGHDRATTIQYLNDVLQRYARVLDKKPELIDAAYDYEYVTDLRNFLMKTKTVEAIEQDRMSMHGKSGGPPEDRNMKRFRMLIPKQPEERMEGPKEAGKGTPKAHKG